MALEIRDIPVLTGETAERFVAEAERVEREARERGPVTYPEEFVQSVERLMERSRKWQKEIDERIRRGETIVFE